AAPADSWDRTSYRKHSRSGGLGGLGASGAREAPTPTTSPRFSEPAPAAPSEPDPDPVSTAETRQRDASGPLGAPPMSVREAENRPPTRERSGQLTPVPPPPDPAPQSGLLSRLAGLFRGRKP